MPVAVDYRVQGTMFLYTVLEPRTLGGLPVPLQPVTAPTDLAMPCIPSQLQNVYQTGGTLVCAEGQRIVATRNTVTPMSGPVPYFPGGPLLPHSATYERTMIPETRFFDAIIGTPPPESYLVTLN